MTVVLVLLAGAVAYVSARFVGELIYTTYQALRGTPHLFTECITPADRREAVIYMVKTFNAIMNDKPVTWWLDYGNLLGAYRMGGMLPWDHDGDIGFLEQDRPAIEACREEFARHGIELNLDRTAIFYRGATVDVEPWGLRGDTLVHGDPALRRGIRKYHDAWHEDFPAAWVRPLWRIRFEGEMLPCPNHPERFLKRRYLTYRLHRSWFFPHKMTCWTCREFWGQALRILRAGYSPVVEERT